jgi:hypothetical protein
MDDTLRPRDHTIEKVGFVEEHGLGIFLNGNEVTVVRRQVLAATKSGDGPPPELTQLVDREWVTKPRPESRITDQNQVVYIWPTADLDDGEYTLVSTIRMISTRTGSIRNLIGTVRVTVAHGCLAGMYFAQPRPAAEAVADVVAPPPAPTPLAPRTEHGKRVLTHERARRNMQAARDARTAAHEGRTNVPEQP